MCPTRLERELLLMWKSRIMVAVTWGRRVLESSTAATLSGLLLVFGFTSTSIAQELVLPQIDAPRPEPLNPLEERRESDEDRITATALFAEGRVLFRHDDFEAALTKYQRAYRYSGRSSTILDEIVPLAFRVGRIGQALRYAQLLDDKSQIDPFVLRRLAIYLTEQDEYRTALRLYRLSTRRSEEAQPANVDLITDFEMGRLSFLVEDYEEAANCFTRVLTAIDQKPDSGDSKAAIDALMKDASATLSLIGETYLEAGRLEGAEKLFRRALTRQEQRPMLQYQLARIAFRREQPKRSLEELERYFEAKSDVAGTAPYELLEQLVAKSDGAENIVERMASVHHQQPDNIFVGYFYAEQLLRAGRASDAIPIFEQLIAERPLLDAYRGLLKAYYAEKTHAKFCLLLADAIGKLDGIDELKDTLQPMATDGTFVDALIETSEREFLEDEQDGPARRSVARALAHIALLGDDDDRADRFFLLAVGDEKPDTNVWLNWSIEQMIDDRLEAAVANLRKLALQPLSDAEAGTVQYYLSGALALSRDETDAAMEAAEEAARRLPEVPTIQVRPAWVLTLGKRWPDARRAYLEILDRWGDEYGSPAVREVIRDAKSSLSTIELELGHLDAAEEWLEQILDEFPTDVGTMNDLGYLWADRGVHLQKALRMIRRATEAHPDNFAYRDSLGWVLFRLGRVDEALVELRRAVDVDEPDGIVLDHLGDVLKVAQGVEAARPQWTRAAEALRESNPALSASIQNKIESNRDVE